MTTPTPNRTGLPDLLPHTTLIQSFDTARFHDDRFEEDELVNLARTEAFMNLLYGREIVVPAGQVAESPAVFKVFLEIMAAYEKHQEKRKRKVPNRARWQPFRIALEPGYADYADYVRQYKDIGAPMVMLPVDEQKRQKDRQGAIAHLGSLFLDGKYQELENTIQRPDYAEYARLVAQYFSEPTAIRPLRDDVTEESVDYQQTLRNRTKRVGEEQLGFDMAEEIADTLPYIAGDRKQESFRGMWYGNRRRFGPSWELARIWLDQALYFGLAEKYGIEHPIYVTQDTESGRVDPQVVLGYETPQGGDSGLGRPQQPNDIDKLPKLNWDVVWDVLTDDGFHYRIDDLTARINNAQWNQELDTAIWQHTEYLNQVFTDIAFDLKNGCYVLSAKKEPGTLKGALAGVLTAGAVPLLLNSFLPGTGAAAVFMQTGVPMLAAGLGSVAEHFVTCESQWFHRRRKKKLERSGREVLDEAMDIVNYWTKPVLDAGSVARARSTRLSPPGDLYA